MPPSYPSTGRHLATLFDTPGSPLDHLARMVLLGSATPPLDRPGESRLLPLPLAHTHPHRHTLRQGGQDALTAWKLKLKPHSIVKLKDFAKDATSKSEVVIFGHVLHLEEMQALLVPTATSFVIPKKFENKLNIHGLRIMLSPTLYAYVKKAGTDSPSGIMKALIHAQTPHWGIWDPVSSRLCHHLTDHRYDIKKMITDSIWVSVQTEDRETTFTECEDATIKITLPMLGCVAILRQVLFDVGSTPKALSKLGV
ncbi:hypothetical protein B0H17DRAFT_1211596 [Mycena rosella]|uniref:Uncharacterized protein n=1 Tax=Mycena rosella TaxID=1033263 RepID=A0AAD7CTW3_MYCRO|nr:hypothetical protein B0H17DRAFT_1211596 [Mycena rosella]